MDYKKLIYYLVANYMTVSNFIIAVLLIRQLYKRKSSNSENINWQDIKPDQIKEAPGKLSDIGPIIGMIIITVIFFWGVTLPVLHDIPYLVNQSYVEFEGIIVQNSEKGITVEVAFENDEPEKVEISGTYSLQEGEKIILEYLPHMKMRMNWYAPDTEYVF